MDEVSAPRRRSRRALPIIAAAVTAVIVAALLYLRSAAPASNPTSSPVRIPAMTGPYTVTYDFIDPATGWALVVDYRGFTINGSFATNFWIFGTSDGAIHWRQLYRGTSPGGLVSHVHFFDAMSGWAQVGDGTFRSVDGGRTWSSVRSPASEGYGGPLLTFAGPDRGWAMTLQGQRTRLYATTDGGTTWSLLPAGIPAGASFGPPGTTSSPAFRESGDGWLGGDYSSTPVVWHTTNGGVSWNPITVSALTGRYATAVRLLPNGGVLVLVDGDLGLEFAFLSQDRGATWRQTALPSALANAEDLAIADGAHWWAFVGGGEALFTTADAGATWQGIPQPGLPEYWNLEAWGAIDATHAWLSLASAANSTHRALAVTSDGGALWKMVNPPQP